MKTNKPTYRELLHALKIADDLLRECIPGARLSQSFINRRTYILAIMGQAERGIEMLKKGGKHD